MAMIRFGMSSNSNTRPALLLLPNIILFGCLCCCIGCGTTKHHTATEQLLMSNAVDATIAKLDFSSLAARKVYLDTTFVNKPGFAGQSLIIDSNYILSSLRQQMVSAGVLLVDKEDDAELIAEPRIGALGIDGHDVIYGIPASNSISNASAVASGTPLLPPLPEISVARREDKVGAAKVAVFAYYKDTRQPYWQSGIAQSNSDSKATWVMGIGPFQRGSIHNGTQFCGGEVVFPLKSSDAEAEDPNIEQYASSQTFQTDLTSAAKDSNDSADSAPETEIYLENGPFPEVPASFFESSDMPTDN